MNGMGHLGRISCTKVLAFHQGQHDLKTPNHRNALSLAGLAQWPIIGKARSAMVSGQDQAKLVFKRQGATSLGGFRQLGKIAINDRQTDGLTLRQVQLLNLFQHKQAQQRASTHVVETLKRPTQPSKPAPSGSGKSK